MNKKICSIMLSLVMTMSVLCSFYGTVLAAPVDPQNPGTIETKAPEAKPEPQEPDKAQDVENNSKEQSKDEPQQTAGDQNEPAMDISDYPDAAFTVAPDNGFNHSGYLDVRCRFNELVFGKLSEDETVSGLTLNISRTAKLCTRNGEEISTLSVTNDRHDLEAGSELVIARTMYDNNPQAPFDFAVYFPTDLFRGLDDGGYKIIVEYQATWTNVMNFSTFQMYDQPLPEPGTISIGIGKFADGEWGSLGNNLNWDFNTENGSLAISGTGAMPDYDPENALTDLSHRPWDHLKDEIKTIVINNRITSVGDYAFSGCTEATTLLLRAGASAIGRNAFEGCGFTSLSIPESITSIGASAFKDCNKLSGKVTVPYTVTSIGDAAFSGCTFSEIELNGQLTSLSKNLFAGCSNLCEVSCKWGVTTIGENAFSGCSSLPGIFMPTSVTSIESGAFKNSGLVEIYILGNVTKISSETFYGCTALKYVTLPDCLTSIEDSAFSGCTRLKTLTIPGSVTSISAGAFADCSNLATVYCLADPDNLTWDASSSDFISSNGTKCYVPSRYQSKYETKFSNLNVDFDSKTIAGGTCGDNINWSLELDGILILSGTGAMYDYEYTGENVAPWYDDYSDEITGIIISDGITTVGDNAFCNCSKLTSARLPDSITRIGENAFRVRTGLESGSLESIVLPNSIESIGFGAFYGQKLRSITIPGSVTTISSGAFRDCDYLETIIILNGVTTIENNAFEYSDNIKSVTVPSSVTSMGDHPFGDGLNLTDIYSYTDPTVWISFSYGTGYNEETKLHVPENMVDSYRSVLNQDSTLITGNNIIGDAKGEGMVNTGVGVHLYGYSLSLAGDISVNFWMKLDSEYLVDDNYMLFAVNGQTQTVKVKDASIGNDGIRLFPCGVAAKEMTDVITAQFCLADGTPAGIGYTYTVREYADYILTHEGYSGSAKNLVKAMLNYGATSQIYFNYKTDSLANSVLSPDDRVVEIMDYREIVHKQNQPGPNQIKPEQVSLVLKSTVSLKLYFDAADVQDYVIRRRGQTLEKTISGNFTIVQTDGITASELNSGVVLDFYDADDVFLGSMVYSPAKYCKLVLYQPTGPVYTEELKRVVTALYKYSKAAEYYIQHPNE